jgi:uncharacterized protein YndB with AHSA1/START domain
MTDPGSGSGRETELDIVRVFDAPRELVFTAWTDPEHLVRWYGPTGFSASEVELDARPGGRWRAKMTDGADGSEHWSSGTYRVIDPPGRLVLTFAWEDADGTRQYETVISIQFADLGGKTEMSFHQAPFRTRDECAGHRGGWLEAFDDLGAALEAASLDGA